MEEKSIFKNVAEKYKVLKQKISEAVKDDPEPLTLTKEELGILIEYSFIEGVLALFNELKPVFGIPIEKIPDNRPLDEVEKFLKKHGLK